MTKYSHCESHILTSARATKFIHCSTMPRYSLCDSHIHTSACATPHQLAGKVHILFHPTQVIALQQSNSYISMLNKVHALFHYAKVLALRQPHSYVSTRNTTLVHRQSLRTVSPCPGTLSATAAFICQHAQQSSYTVPLCPGSSSTTVIFTRQQAKQSSDTVPP